MPRKPAHAAPADVSGPREVPSDYHDDRWVEIYPEPAMARDTARALLAAADTLGYDPSAVVSIGGGFRVPSDILDATDLPTEPQTADVEAQIPLAAIQAGAAPNATDSTDAGT